MRRVSAWPYLLVLACTPPAPGGTDTATDASTTGASSTAATSSATTGSGATSTTGSSTSGDDLTTSAPPSEPWQDQYEPCVDGMCPNGGICLQFDGASVCGPPCYEKGPGSFRCPESEIQEQTICPWPNPPTADQAACFISCATADDCPDPNMVCMPCAEHFAEVDCALGIGFGKGPDMCAWSDI